MSFKKTFKEQRSFEERKEECDKMRSKHPEKIPVIVEKHVSCILANLEKNKYLIPEDLTVGQFINVIRKKIKINDTEAIFLFVNNSIPPTSAQMSKIYNEHKDDDGYLYCVYSSENTFGC